MEQETINFLKRVYTLAAILVGVLVLFLISEINYSQNLIDQQNQNQITVYGEGKVYAKPDIATVTLGFRTEGVDVKEITSKNIELVNKMISDLKGLKIEEKDIQTTQYSVYPKYNWTERSGNVPDGYTIEQNIQVKIRNFDNIGNVLNVASSNGANIINSLQFTIDDPEQLKQQARAEAIKKAKDNAKNLAKESGIKLGKLINVYENANSYPMMYESALAKDSSMPGSAPIPTIEPGQQEISTTINLTYIVK